MVLHDVADGAGLLVEAAAALYAEVLRHRDLHALDVLAVPERLEQRVREAEEHHVSHRPLAEVVIDAKDVLLVESVEQDAVQRLRRSEIAAKRLLDEHPRTARRATCLRQTFDDLTEQSRRYREIVRGTGSCAKELAECCEGRGVGIVAVDVAQELHELAEC